jgi:hypothetical protein
MTEKKKTIKEEKQVYGYLIGELSFIILPFLVMTLIYLDKNNLDRIFEEPSWSLTAAVLYGQSIIKMIHTVVKASMKGMAIKHYNVGALISLQILLGLVPSLVILSLIYNHDVVPIWLIILQMIVFVLSIISYCLVSKLQVEEE